MIKMMQQLHHSPVTFTELAISPNQSKVIKKGDTYKYKTHM